jgi:hypothetical protein
MTEGQQRAADAWKQVVRKRSIFDTVAGEGPMPPAIAIDFVQDVVDDRMVAVDLLYEAARLWLQMKMPAESKTGQWNVDIGWRMAATKLCDGLESDESVDFDSLHSFRAAVHNAVSPELRHSLFVLESWRKWTWDAERVFDILDEIDVKA